MSFKLNLSNYPNQEKIKNEISQLQKQFNNLECKMEFYEICENNTASIKLQFDIQIYHEKYQYLYVNFSFYLPVMYPLIKPILRINPPKQFEIVPISDLFGLDGIFHYETIETWNNFTSNIGLLSLTVKKWIGENFPFAKSQNNINKDYDADKYVESNLLNPKALREAAESIVYGIHSSYSYPGGKPQTYVDPQHQIPDKKAVIKGNPLVTLTSYPMIFHREDNEITQEESLVVKTHPDFKNNRVVGSKASVQHAEDLILQNYYKELQYESKRKAVLEKYQRIYNESMQFYSVNINYLTDESNELRRKSLNYEHLLKQIRIEQEYVESEVMNEQAINKKLTSIYNTIKQQMDQGIPYNDTVDTTLPLYKQLVSLYLEDQSLEDTIIFLDIALGKNIIDLETFLKKVREIYRRQFILKATIDRCRSILKLIN